MKCPEAVPGDSGSVPVLRGHSVSGDDVSCRPDVSVPELEELDEEETCLRLRFLPRFFFPLRERLGLVECNLLESVWEKPSKSLCETGRLGLYNGRLAGISRTGESSGQMLKTSGGSGVGSPWGGGRSALLGTSRGLVAPCDEPGRSILWRTRKGLAEGKC